MVGVSEGRLIVGWLVGVSEGRLGPRAGWLVGVGWLVSEGRVGWLVGVSEGRLVSGRRG